MQIDCRNLTCPQPVINTKAALEELRVGQELSVLVDELAPLENVKRFLSNLGMRVEVVKHENYQEIKTVKISKITDIFKSEFECDKSAQNHDQGARNRLLYLDDDRAGRGEVGEVLMAKFISSVKNLEIKPKFIICVNNAVKMTANRAHTSFMALKELEEIGVKILSCGTCLEAYGLVDKLCIGEVTNAYEIMKILMENDAIKL